MNRVELQYCVKKKVKRKEIRQKENDKGKGEKKIVG